VLTYVLGLVLSLLIPHPFPRVLLTMAVMKTIIQEAKMNKADAASLGLSVFVAATATSMVLLTGESTLNIATVGNPNMHPWFHIPTLLGMLPGMSAAASWMMNREIAKLDFPPVDEFVQLVMDSGTCVYGCKMSMDMMKLTKDDLVDGADVLGAMEFLEIADGAQVLFV